MGMMYFQVEEDKVEKVSKCLEKGLTYIGKAMSCVEEMMQGGGSMGERDDYDSPYEGGRMGERRWGNQYGGGRMGRRMGGHYGSRDEYPMMYRDPYYE